MSQQDKEPQCMFEHDEELAHAIAVAKSAQKQSSPHVIIQQTPCPQVNMSKYFFVMVGLPARGKSYVAKIIARYLSWLSIKCNIVNVGNYRRNILGAGQESDFFNGNNQDNVSARKKLSEVALTDAIKWLKEGGQVVLFDATNTTRDRRENIVNTLLADEELGMTKQRIIFLEIICDDPKIIEANVREIKVKSNDYLNWDPEKAYQDFSNRIKQYEKVYEPLCDQLDDALSYVKLINISKKIVLNRISGYLPGRITSLLMNLNIIPKKIFLCRTGESEYISKSKIGGDSSLTEKGVEFAKVMADFIKSQGLKELVVWTSTMKRGLETCAFLQDYPIIQFKALDELSFGIHDGETYDSIAQNMPHDLERRNQDKYRYRFPRGESYEDVCNRVEPVIVELERQQTPVLIVSHNATTKILYSYLMGIKPEKCVEIDLPIHSVIELIPGAYVNNEKTHQLM